MNLKYFYLAFAFAFFSIAKTYSQCSSVVVIQNPSFEGNPGSNTAPPSWTSCHPGWGPDIQPGSGLNSGAYEGSTFLGLNYNYSQGATGVSQQLNVPLASGVTYTSSIELASYEYEGGQKFDPNCASVQIYGGFSSCDLNTLLWNSGTIQQWSSWQNYPISFTPNQNFTYISIVISGCSSYAYVGVDTIAPFTPNFSASAVVNRNNLCAHDSAGQATVSAIGNIPNLTYLWSSIPHQTDSVLSNVPAGTYTVTVTGNNGALCATASVTITAPPVLTVSASAITNTCFTNGHGSATASASGGVPSYTFLWSNGDVGSTSGNDLSPGTYKVTVTDSHHCTASASVTIDPVDPMNITAYVKPAACPNYNNGYITASVTGGSPNYTYLWSAASGNTGITLFNDTVGNYTVTVTDAHTCTAAATFYVGATSPSDSLAVISNATPCNGHTINGSITANASGGTPSYTYLWNTNPPQYGATAINLAPGTYTVTATDGAGCTVVSSATIVLSGGINLNLTPSNSSCGDSTGSAVAYVSGASSPHYHWSNGATSDTLKNVSQGTYRVTVTSSNGCSATGQVDISTTHSNDSVHITSDNLTICSGDSAYICAPSGYASYHWNNSPDNNPCVYTQYAGNSYLTVTEQNGCTVESNHLAVTVLQNPPVAISANGDTLKSYGSVTYRWYLNGVLIPDATDSIYVAHQTGDYTVYVTAENGCHQTSIAYHFVYTGISDLSENTWVKVYPNPSTSGAWQLQVGSNMLGSTVEIFDDNGRLVYKSQVRSLSSPIDLDVAKGVYLMRVISQYKNFNLKLTRL